MSKALKAKTEEIKKLLVTDNALLEMAVVAIWERQTASEKSIKTTNQDNGVGFASCDANNGSYYATYIIKGMDQYGKTWGQNLSGKHLEKARKFMPKYAGQLAKIELSKVQGEDLEPEPDGAEMSQRDRRERHDVIMRPGSRLYENEDGEQEWEMCVQDEADA